MYTAPPSDSEVKVDVDCRINEIFKNMQISLFTYNAFTYVFCLFSFHFLPLFISFSTKLLHGVNIRILTCVRSGKFTHI